MPGKDGKTLTELFRKLIVKLDIVFHIVAALLLISACALMLYYAFLNLLDPSHQAVIKLINDVLLALIILELLWTILRFLKRQKFILAPFLAIGIIAAIRRILLIEAQTSLMEHVPEDKLYEIGLSGMIVLVLMIAYFLSVKAEKIESE
jgi:uncharacterized membrane protein (DUF373 family)